MTDRRAFLASTSAAALATLTLPRAAMAAASQGSDPLKNLIVVNALGGPTRATPRPLPDRRP